MDSVETISAITRDDLVDFHAHHFGPENMVVVVVGAVKPDEVFDLFTDKLGGWKNPKVVAAPQFPMAEAPQKTIRERISLKGKSQADIVMGTLGPKRNAPEYLAASLGNNILGQFGMMGRIGEVVREKAEIGILRFDPALIHGSNVVHGKSQQASIQRMLRRRSS